MVSLPEPASADLNSADFPLTRHPDEFANGIIIGTQIYGRLDSPVPVTPDVIAG
jgi:hypothetical protein